MEFPSKKHPRFSGIRVLVMPDPRHSQDESRYVVLGRSSSGNLLVVIDVERGDNIRIISARQATPREKRRYAQG